MLEFGRSLPRIRKSVQRHLNKDGLPKQKVLATVIKLLEISLIRVGNEEYVKQNQSFGLTTMRDRHVEVRGSSIRFHFKGKSGKKHDVDVQDPKLARIVKKCQDIPGQELFQFIDPEGNRQSISSNDVNDYLREIAGEEFSAKDFRTWAGTVLAALALQEFEKFDSQTQAKKNVIAAIESVSQRLGNTPAICKKCYIHPIIFDSYLDGTLVETLRKRANRQMREELSSLRPEEAAVLAFIETKLSQPKPSLKYLLKKSLKKVSKKRFLAGLAN
ncbi:MAG: topoisomerase [Verrucomicrobiales bacterium]|nr:topoisomerase [Verrucomicrobiales bacterium]